MLHKILHHNLRTTSCFLLSLLIKKKKKVPGSLIGKNMTYTGMSSYVRAAILPGKLLKNHLTIKTEASILGVKKSFGRTRFFCFYESLRRQGQSNKRKVLGTIPRVVSWRHSHLQDILGFKPPGTLMAQLS